MPKTTPPPGPTPGPTPTPSTPPSPPTTHHLPPLLTTPLLTLFLLLVTLLISIPLKTYHTLITLLKPLLAPTLLTQLTPYDSIFAIDNLDHPHAANITLIYLHGNLTLDQVLEKFTLLLKKPNFIKLKQIIINFHGYFFWKNCLDFNLSKHIKSVDNLFPWLLEEEEHDAVLFNFLAERMVEGFDPGAPLWDVGVVGGFGNGETVLVIRIHHTYADGYSQNFLVDEIFGVKSGYFVKGKRGGGGGGGKLLPLILRAPSMLTSLYRDALTSPPNYYTQKKTSTTGVITITTLDLPKYKQIRRKTSTHFASIGMSLMCGALRKYYSETHPPETLPPTVGIMHSLPKPNHPLTKLVNHWGVGLFKIPISISDPLERLIKTEENFVQYLDLGFDDLLHLHMPILGWFPSVLLRRFFNLNFGTSMGFTSVPAVEEGVKWGDLEVTKLGKVFGFQWGQTAIATAVYTHRSTATITLYANKDIVPDQEAIDRVGRYLREEFDELGKLVDVSFRRSGGGKLG